MITFEQAKKTALSVDKFDMALDYGDAFVFGFKEDQKADKMPIAVRKSDGKVAMFTAYIISRKGHDSPKSLPM